MRKYDPDFNLWDLENEAKVYKYYNQVIFENVYNEYL